MIKPTFFRETSLWWRLAFIFLGMACLVNAVRGITSTQYVYGSGDFYVRWYHGQFMRERVNPYNAYLNDTKPVTPKQYFDGRSFNKLPDPWVPLGAPTNTSVTLVLLSPFALVSWWSAKWIWMVFNYCILFATPRFALGMVPEEERWPIKYQVLLHLLFGSIFAIRNSIGNGQTGPFVVLCMVMSLALVRKRPLLAGVAFGLALSKYSLSLPLLFVYLYRKEWKVIFVGGMVQAIGLAIMSIWTSYNPILILLHNIEIGRQHLPIVGIHLMNMFPNGGILVVVVALLIMLFLGRVWRQDGKEHNRAMSDLGLTTILTLWLLLSIYHGPYDGIVLIFPQVFVIHGILYPHHWNLTPQRRKIVIGITILFSFIFTLPRAISLTYPPRIIPWWAESINNLFTITIVLILIGCMVLFRFGGGFGNAKS